MYLNVRGTHPSILRKTVLLQKRAIRYIHKENYNSHKENLFRKCKLLKLREQYEYETLLFINGFADDNLPRSFDHIFKYNRDVLTAHHPRQSNMIQIDRCCSNCSKHL